MKARSVKSPLPIARAIEKVNPGDMVVLDTLPVGLLHELPKEDQAAIRAIIGRPVMLAGYSFGQAELEFVDNAGDNHSIWIEPSLLRAAPRSVCHDG